MFFFDLMEYPKPSSWLAQILVNESKEEYRLWNRTGLSSKEGTADETFGKSSRLTGQRCPYLWLGTLVSALH